MTTDDVIKQAKDRAEQLGINRESDWNRLNLNYWTVYKDYRNKVSDAAKDEIDFLHGIKGICDALKV